MRAQWTSKRAQRALMGAKVALCGVLTLPCAAWAGGFEFPDTGTRAMARGGAFAALADDLTAIAHNPGALIRGTGTRFLYNHHLTWGALELTRQPSLIDNTGFDQLTNPAVEASGVFPLGITAVLGSDFGLEDWSFAVGVYGPNAAGKQEYSANGAQRYLLTDLDVALVYFTASVAYGKRDTWGVGASLQYVYAPFVRIGLMVDATPNNQTKVNPSVSAFDVAAKLDLSDPASFTAIVGGWWRVIPELELAVTSRVIPIALGLDGSVSFSPVGSAIASSTILAEGTGASMDLTLPAYVRAAVRYRHVSGERELFDVELDATWENWSTVKSYDMNLRGTAEVPAVFFTELPDLEIPRNWKDTFSVRLGGTYSPIELLGISLGGFWESGAIPNNYEHIDFPSFDRFGISGGLRFQFEGVDLNIAYMHIFQQDRTVDERFAKVYQVRPVTPCDENPAQCNGSTTGAPSNSGKYVSSFDILSVGFELHFDQWFED